LPHVRHPAIQTPIIAWTGEASRRGVRCVPEEVPVALTYNRATHAVMLASPMDLEDFAVGFSLSEGIIRDAAEIQALDIVTVQDGIECRMDLPPERLDTLTRRQRRLAGPSGCGLCGLDSLAAAVRAFPRVSAGRVFSVEAVHRALQTLSPAQALNAATRAVHAAGFWTPEKGLVALREDVGRHNALDKLAGALARGRLAPVDGLLLLSSRVSVEMVQKAAALGVPVIVAVSAPTALAIQVADRAGVTLIGVAREDGFEVFTNLQRIDVGPCSVSARTKTTGFAN